MYGCLGRDSKGVDCIPSHVKIVSDEEKIMYFSVHVVSVAILIRWY